MSKKKGIFVAFSSIVMVLILANISIPIYQTSSAAAVVPSTSTPTKTYQDFGLGFRIEYSSGMLVEKGSEQGSQNVTFYTPQISSTDKFLSVEVTVTPISVVSSLGLNPYDLDVFATQTSLGITNAGHDVTNKTKLVVDNVSAYQIQFNGINQDNVKHLQDHQGEKFYVSNYVMIRHDIVYIVAFITFNPTKFLPLEYKIIQSFRFV